MSGCTAHAVSVLESDHGQVNSPSEIVTLIGRCCMTSDAGFARLIREIRSCTLCAASLPLGPRPIVRGSPASRLLVISQAPGTRGHETGLSFDDKSGDRLRQWMGIDRDLFYDESRVAVMGMGFCYPGRERNGGDLPPRPECAPLWHARLREHFAAVGLNLLVGGYAIRP